MRVVGIDPGFSGALVLWQDNELGAVIDMPVLLRNGKQEIDIAMVCSKLLAWSPDVVVIEAVGAAPGQGLGSTFRFGFGAGQISGAAVALGFGLLRVLPATWKAGLRLPGGKAGKTASRDKASELWPDWASSFKRVADDGRAEAALIAQWCVVSGHALAVVKQRVEAGAQDPAAKAQGIARPA